MEEAGWAPAQDGAGAIVVGTAGIRKEPDHASELLTQGILGETFRILDRSPDGKWLRVRLDRDGYSGWLRGWYATEMTASHCERWRDEATAWIGVDGAEIREEAARAAFVLALAPWQARVRPIGTHGAWTEVELPDGRRGHAPKRSLDLRPVPGGPASPRRVLKTAAGLLGSPYLWGGRTRSGFDCSGLIQAAFAWHGTALPRDAVEQRSWFDGRGRPRRTGGKGEDRWRGLKPGDLLFFGQGTDRVTHVALATGPGDFIHAYGWVRYGSLRESSQVYVPQLVESFLEAYSPAR